MKPDDIDLNLALLRGPADQLTDRDRAALCNYIARPSAAGWQAVAPLSVGFEDKNGIRPLLRDIVLRAFPEFKADITYRRAGAQTEQIWNRIPSQAETWDAIRTFTRTATIAPITLELELARSNGNRLTDAERRALTLLYYMPHRMYLYEAKDIELNEFGGDNGLGLNFIQALDAVDPSFLNNSLRDEIQGGRTVKVIVGAPTSDSVRAALIFATH